MDALRAQLTIGHSALTASIADLSNVRSYNLRSAGSVGSVLETQSKNDADFSLDDGDAAAGGAATASNPAAAAAAMSKLESVAGADAEEPQQADIDLEALLPAPVLRCLASDELGVAELAECWSAVVGVAPRDAARRLCPNESSPQLLRDWLRQCGAAERVAAAAAAAAKGDGDGDPAEVAARLQRIHGDASASLAALHATLLAPYVVRGVVVTSDSCGLSKLSQKKRVLEVLRLIHEPKTVIAAAARQLGGRPIGAWVADNTATFFPLPPAAAAPPSASRNLTRAAAAAASEREFTIAVVRAMLRAQDTVARRCAVQVGMAVHAGSFIALGGSLLGSEAEHVEELAEDFTSAREIAVTGETAVRVFNALDMASGAAGNAKAGMMAAVSPHFSLLDRGPDDEMRAYRVVAVDADGDFSFAGSDDEADDASAALSAAGGDAAYPSGFTRAFYNLIDAHRDDVINDRAAEVEHLAVNGVYLLVKVRGPRRDLELDQLTQRVVVRAAVARVVSETNALAAAAAAATKRQPAVVVAAGGKRGRGGGVAAAAAPAPASAATTPPSTVRLIKCNGDIAIVVATDVTIAMRFAFDVVERITRIGSGASGLSAEAPVNTSSASASAPPLPPAADSAFCVSVGAWSGSAFVFDLAAEGTSAESDVAGAPVNIASKLAEDFGRDGGVYFGRFMLVDYESDMDSGGDAAAAAVSSPARQQERVVVGGGGDDDNYDHSAAPARQQERVVSGGGDGGYDDNYDQGAAPLSPSSPKVVPMQQRRVVVPGWDALARQRRGGGGGGATTGGGTGRDRRQLPQAASRGGGGGGATVVATPIVVELSGIKIHCVKLQESAQPLEL